MDTTWDISAIQRRAVEPVGPVLTIPPTRGGVSGRIPAQGSGRDDSPFYALLQAADTDESDSETPRMNNKRRASKRSPPYSPQRSFSRSTMK
ncbi:MAG: hypothetical protein HQL95_15105 [Magnetococcales bacterium]|nr:hypothetical protein [Magnetococcales bacterium]